MAKGYMLIMISVMYKNSRKISDKKYGPLKSTDLWVTALWMIAIFSFFTFPNLYSEKEKVNNQKAWPSGLIRAARAANHLYR